MTSQIRPAVEADLAAITDIYNWTIVDNHVSFDLEPFTLESRLAWWRARDPELTCLVAEVDGEVVGVSYSSWYRPKPAYRSSMETTIVVAAGHRRRGWGSRLLGELLDRLETQGIHRAIAIVALPNDASVELHRRLGYRTVGVLTEVGDKLGRHWDTMLLECPLPRSGGSVLRGRERTR